MIAAIYARKPTDQNGISDDQKSVARQIEHARAYADPACTHALSVDATRARRVALEADLAEVETELARLSAAMPMAGALDTILNAIRVREGKRAELRTALDQLAPLPDLDPKAVAREVTDRVNDWRGLLRRQPSQGQQILRKLRVG